MKHTRVTARSPDAKPSTAGAAARRPSGRAARAETPAVRDSNGRTLDQYLGNVIRELRRHEHLTIADIAQQASISRGMLSKIENGQVSPSLDTLSKIAGVLGVSLSHMFRYYNVPAGSAKLVKRGSGMEVVRRGTKRGHTYHLLAYDQGPQKVFEPFLVTLDDKSEIFPAFEHPGTEFIYVLKGQLDYRHGNEVYPLAPGDALTFRGEVPHGPERLIKTPIVMLAIIIYGGDRGDYRT